MFSQGGIQGGEGVTGGEAWYIENVMEELDSEREWFFDAPTSTLYYKPNSTEADAATGAPTGAFVATNLKVLFNITGTKASPAHHIAIQGVTLRDTVRSGTRNSLSTHAAAAALAVAVAVVVVVGQAVLTSFGAAPVN